MFEKILLTLFVLILLDMLGYPVSLHDPVTSVLIVLHFNEFRDNHFKLLLIYFRWAKIKVHFMRSESQIGVKNKRCRQVIIFGQLLWSHTNRLHDNRISSPTSLCITEKKKK